ncbi:MAG: hypothetical protein QF790_05020 [Gammaproteobacteria bacterium]|jgi:hypothetical protein|nr:hypothetical protein [Gammaproteobacteria bacterium]MDP6616509.1 hypothetical protein [Gammaproteobacteria bacterium]MDP6694242.1 hypothetical protein [Gammaproteobacteria bacterium]
MSDTPYSFEFIERLIDKSLAALDWEERPGADGGPYMSLTFAENPDQGAGYVRVWGAPTGPMDRMIHMRMQAGPVETQLLFLFGRSDTSMPHLHAQVVQFPPAGYVYNIDLIPRLDAIDHPEWFEKVFGPLRRPYKKAVSNRDNSCAQAPANPALAVFMSPWGIGSAHTDRDELDRVEPSIVAYMDHYLVLAADSWDVADPAGQAARDQRHMERFFADDLDPRAWNGVYRIIGEESGRAVKALFQSPLPA